MLSPSVENGKMFCGYLPVVLTKLRYSNKDSHISYVEFVDDVIEKEQHLEFIK